MFAVFGSTTNDQVSYETFNSTITADSASYKLSSINHLVELHQDMLGLITSTLGASISVRGDTVVMLQRGVDSPKEFTVLSMKRAGRVLPTLAK